MFGSILKKPLPPWALIFAAGILACSAVSAADPGTADFLPGHTLEADAQACMNGAQNLTESVAMSKDGFLMVVHEIFLDTTTDVAQKFPGRTRRDGRYYVSDFTAAELKTLRVYPRFNPITHEPVIKGHMPSDAVYRIPTLSEAMDQVEVLNFAERREIKICVELLEPAFFENEGLDILDAAIKTLTAYGYNYEGSGATLDVSDGLAAVRSIELGWEGGLDAEPGSSVDKNQNNRTVL